MADFEQEMVLSRELEDGITIRDPDIETKMVAVSKTGAFWGDEDFHHDEDYTLCQDDLQNTVGSESRTLNGDSININLVNYTDLMNGVETKRTYRSVPKEIPIIKTAEERSMVVESHEYAVLDATEHQLISDKIILDEGAVEDLQSFDEFVLRSDESGLHLESQDGVTLRDEVVPLVTIASIIPISWALGVFSLGVTAALLLYSLMLVYLMKNDNNMSFGAEFAGDGSVILDDVDIVTDRVLDFKIDKTKNKVELQTEDLDTKWVFSKEGGVYPPSVVELFESVGFTNIESDQVDLHVKRNITDEVEGIKSEDEKWVIPTDQNIQLSEDSTTEDTQRETQLTTN